MTVHLKQNMFILYDVFFSSFFLYFVSIVWEFCSNCCFDRWKNVTIVCIHGICMFVRSLTLLCQSILNNDYRMHLSYIKQKPYNLCYIQPHCSRNSTSIPLFLFAVHRQSGNYKCQHSNNVLILMLWKISFHIRSLCV